MILYLARHGESDWNVANRFQGVTDRPLTDRGRTQAEELAQEVAGKGIDAVYSSPLRRALDTAAIVAGRLVRASCRPGSPRDRRRQLGWSLRAEVESRFSDAFHRWVGGGDGWDDGELRADVEASPRRGCPIAGAHPTGSVLLISHGGPIRAIPPPPRAWTCTRTGESGPSSPTRLSAVAVEGERVTRID